MDSDFRVTIRSEGDATVLALAGELDLASCQSLEAAVGRALGPAPRLVILDLGQLEFMDIAGLRSLVRSAQRARGLGKRLVIAGPRAAVRRLFALTDQAAGLDIVASASDAVV